MAGFNPLSSDFFRPTFLHPNKKSTPTNFRIRSICVAHCVGEAAAGCSCLLRPSRAAKVALQRPHDLLGTSPPASQYQDQRCCSAPAHFSGMTCAKRNDKACKPGLRVTRLALSWQFYAVMTGDVRRRHGIQAGLPASKRSQSNSLGILSLLAADGNFSLRLR